MAVYIKSLEGTPIVSAPTREIEELRLSYGEKARVIAAAIHARYPCAEIFGFGSTFTGFGFRKDSDIDIAVRGVPVANHAKLWNLAVDAAGMEDVDIVMMEEADPRVIASILRDGVIL